MICRICSEDVLRIRSAKKRTSRGYHYEDGTGRFWNGRICPPCRSEYNKGGDKFVSDTITKRPCRTCKKPLPKSRYFTHVDCAPIIDYWDPYEMNGGLASPRMVVNNFGR